MKSKYSEVHTISVEGILNVDDMTIEIDEIGIKELREILENLNGCNIKFRVALSNDLD
jgi:hypothetical protein